MAYKRNPMRSERICALARHVMALLQDAQMTAATQWFERTLDDSAIRRLSVPEALLAADAALNLYLNIMENPQVYPKIIEKHLRAELPFMATENILMAAVKRGGDRQTLHEVIRAHAQAAAARVKQEGLENDLLERLAADPAIPLSSEEVHAALDPSHFVGRAPQQIVEFMASDLQPFLDRNHHRLGVTSDVRV